MASLTHDQRELESELHELEQEGTAEGEGILGAIGNVLGGLLGEQESHETVANGELGELGELGEFEAGTGELHELSHELGELEGGLGELGETGLGESGELGEMGEFEAGEQFFGNIARRIGRFVKRAAPLLKSVARIAAPMVGTAIGGPFGAILGKVASSALREQELELNELHEFEAESEFELEGETELQELEGEQEAAHEVAHEIAHHEATLHEALAEMMAEAGAQEANEGQAEALVGAATITVISPADRRALRRILPHLVRGAAILTRVLRRRRLTRPAVRLVPTIMRRTVRSLKRAAAAGHPITRRLAARAAAAQVRRVLGNPTACAAAITKNVAASRRTRGPRRAAA